MTAASFAENCAPRDRPLALFPSLNSERTLVDQYTGYLQDLLPLHALQSSVKLLAKEVQRARDPQLQQQQQQQQQRNAQDGARLKVCCLSASPRHGRWTMRVVADSLCLYTLGNKDIDAHRAHAKIPSTTQTHWVRFDGGDSFNGAEQQHQYLLVAAADALYVWDVNRLDDVHEVRNIILGSVVMCSENAGLTVRLSRGMMK